MMSAVLLILSSAIAGPLTAPVEMPEWISARVWPDEAGTPVAIAELYGAADPELGAHRGLHTAVLDGCWRQHAAHGGDLSLSFCADVRVSRSGRARAKVRALSDPRPGLAACIDASLEAWPGIAGSPARGEVCRAVATNISREARGVWVTDPWAVVTRAGLTHLDAAVPPIEVGRARAEDAVRLVPDPATGGLVRASAPLGVRDRATSTARRMVTGQRVALEQCWRDHAHWRLPPESAEDEPWMAFTLEITVGPAGAESVVAGRTSPVTHADVARCVAAALDQGVPPEAGSQVVEVPVLVWGFDPEPTPAPSGPDEADGAVPE